MMIYSSVGYCRCGQEIYLEYIQAGAGWTPRFSDEDLKEITHCPGCGRELVEDELQSL